MSTESILALYGPEPVTVPDVQPQSTPTVSTKTLVFPTEVEVPTIDSLPSRSAPASGKANLETSPAGAASVDRKETVPITWNDADLDYLVEILFPDLVKEDRIYFVPSLADLQCQSSGHIDLKLYAKAPASTACSVQDDSNAKPLCLASSGFRSSPAKARRALAQMLLRDIATINTICSKYLVMGILLSVPSARLSSILSGMQHIAAIDPFERAGRMIQLGAVDEFCDIEPRLEAYLLGPGFLEIGSWVECAAFALKVEEEDKMVWVETYNDAVTFLSKALRHLD